MRTVELNNCPLFLKSRSSNALTAQLPLKGVQSNTCIPNPQYKWINPQRYNPLKVLRQCRQVELAFRIRHLSIGDDTSILMPTDHPLGPGILKYAEPQ